MNPPRRQSTIESLLAERAWLRRLAGALGHDAALADDLAQDAWLAAVRKPPSSVRSPRAWLGAVLRNRLRNVRRDAGRREAREERATHPRRVDSPDDAVARAELLERVGRFVLELDEPYRTTVVLRYFEDLPPREIAARMGAPVETVRTRLKRALARLEKRLDEAHDGDRRTWMTALLPIVPLPTAAGMTGGAGGGVLAMSTTTTTKMALPVVLAVLVLAGVVPLLWGMIPRPSEPAPVGDMEVASAGLPENVASEAPTLTGTRDAAAPAPAPTWTGDGASQGAALVGRVLGAGRHPVADATVVLRVDGRRVADAKTNDSGTFRVGLGGTSLEPAEELPCSLHATTGDGRAALRAISWKAELGTEHDVGELVLTPSGAIDLRVTSSTERAPPAEIHVLGEGFDLRGIVLRARTDGEGHLHVTDLPEHVYRVAAVAVGCGRRAAYVRVRGGGEQQAELRLDPEDILDVRVVVGTTDRPLADAGVRVMSTIRRGRGTGRSVYEPQPEIAPTDADGRTRVAGMAVDGTWDVVARFTGTGYPAGHYQSVPVPPGTRRVILRFPEPTGVAWPVAAGEVPPPPDGTRLAVLPCTRIHRVGMPEEGRMVGGRIVLGYRPPHAIQAFASSPEGHLALLGAGKDEDVGEETAFRRPRAVHVIGRDARGEPLEGHAVSVIGVNAPRQEPVPLDANGEGRVEGLYGGTVHVRLHRLEGASWRFVEDVGQVDVEGGDARLEFSLSDEPDKALDVHVTCDGRAALPDRYHLSAEGAGVSVVREDPERGLLRVKWRAVEERERFRLSVESDAHLASHVWVDREATRVTLDLMSAGALELRILRASDGRQRVGIQAWDPVARAWGIASGVRSREAHATRTAALDVRLFRGLQAGRHRARDILSGCTSGPVEVVAGGTPAVLELDLRRVGVGRGRVEAPPGTDLTRARVRPGTASAPGLSAFTNVRVRADGSFAVRIPGDRPCTFHVSHPVLRTDPDEGVITLTRPRDDLVLKLLGGGEARLLLRLPAESAKAPRSATVLFFRDRVGGELVHELSVRATRDGDRLELPLRGYPAGTYTLWIDTGTFAPLVREGVELGPEMGAVGPFDLEEGSRVRVRLIVKQGEVPQILVLKAVHQGEPAYERWDMPEGTTEASVKGLRRGRYRVTVRAYRDHIDDEGPPHFDEVIAVDGEQTVERTIELR